MDTSDIKIKLTLQVGSNRVSLADLEAMEVNSVIELDTLAGEDLKVFANDSLIAFGSVVLVNERYGIKIKKLAKKATKTPKKR